MKKFIFLIILFAVFFSACGNVDLSQVSDEDLERISDKAVVCEKPYIRFGTTCCLDENENGICDKDDSEKEKILSENNNENKSSNNELGLKLENLYVSHSVDYPLDGDIIISGNIDISWNLIEEARCYDIQLKTINLFSKEESDYYSTYSTCSNNDFDLNSYSLLGLSPDNIYHIKIISKNENKQKIKESEVLIVEFEDWCIDSDNLLGKEENYNKGKTADHGEKEFSEDFCKDDTTLVEYSCSLDTISNYNYFRDKTEINCSNGCFAGACDKEAGEDYIHIYVFTDGAKVELEIDGTYEEYSTDSNKNGYIMDEISERYGLGHYYAHTITKSFYDEDMFQSLTIRVEEDEIRVSMLFYDNTGTGQTYSEGQSLDYVFENIANFYGIDKEILREKSTIKYYNDSDSDDDYSELIPEKVKFSLGEDETTTITLGEYDYTFKYGDVTEDDSVTNTQINYLILGDRKVFEDVEPHGTKIKVMVLDTYYSSRDGVQSYADFIVGNYNWKLETTDVDNRCVERTYAEGLDYVISPNKEQTEVVIKEDYCKDTSTLIKYGCIVENGIEYYEEYEDECSHPQDLCSNGICLTCGVGPLDSGKVTLQLGEEYISTIGTPLELLSVEDNSIILKVGTAGNVTIEGDCNDASIASYTFKLHETFSSGYAEFSYSIDYGTNSGGGSGSSAGGSKS